MNKYAVQNLFGIEGLNIAWYGIIIGAGILAGTLLAIFRARREKIDTDILYDFLLLALPISIFCARAYYVIFRWEYYQLHLSEIPMIWRGGLAIYGGVLGAIVTAMLFCRRRKLSFFQLADICIPGLLLGQVIGRWGNFVNQEAFGQLVSDPQLKFFPYAVYIDELGEWHQAAFFYESLWNLCLLCLLLLLCSRLRVRGLALPIYLIGYGTGRFWIESLRADSLYLFPGVRISQVVSILLIATGCCLLFILLRRMRIKRSLEQRCKT